MTQQGADYVAGIPEMTSLAVYVLASLFPDPSTTAPGSTSTQPFASNANSTYQLPSPPPDTPPQSPQFTSCDSAPRTPPSHTSHSSKFPTSHSRATHSAPPTLQSTSAPILPTPPPLAGFIAHILVRTRIPVPTFHRALILLTKLKSRYPKAYGTHASGHRLFVAAAMLVCGMDMDDAYRRASWVEVCRGLFTGRELSRMEIEFLAFLNFSAHVRDHELASWVQSFVLPYCIQTNSTAPLAGFYPHADYASQPRAQQSSHTTKAQQQQPQAQAQGWSRATPLSVFGECAAYGPTAPPSPPASPTYDGAAYQGKTKMMGPVAPRLCAWGGEAMVRDRRMSIG